MTYVVFKFGDSSKETATARFNLPGLLADGSNYAAITAIVDALKAALLDVCDGVIMETAIIANRERLTNVWPVDTSEREMKWLVRYESNSTKKVYRLEVPCRLTSSMPIASGTDFVDLENPAVHAERDAFIAALESCRGPDGGALTVISIERVGRTGQ